MSYTSAEGRTQLLEVLAEAVDQLAVGLACLGAAYEVLDDAAGEQLEEELFRPVQLAYGRARRAHGAFGARNNLPERKFEPRSPGPHAGNPKPYIERAIDAIELADHEIAELQDSLLPVEVGDPELRAGLAGTRELIAHVPARGRLLLRRFGR